MVAACDKKEEKKDDRKADKKAETQLRGCTRNAKDVRIESIDGRDIELVITQAAGILDIASGDEALATLSFPTMPLPQTVAITTVQPGFNFSLEIEGVEREARGCELEFTVQSKIGRAGPFVLCREADDCRADGMTVAVVQQGAP